jgi:hypothetical protein
MRNKLSCRRITVSNDNATCRQAKQQPNEVSLASSDNHQRYNVEGRRLNYCDVHKPLNTKVERSFENKQNLQKYPIILGKKTLNDLKTLRDPKKHARKQVQQTQAQLINIACEENDGVQDAQEHKYYVRKFFIYAKEEGIDIVSYAQSDEFPFVFAYNDGRTVVLGYY